MVRLVSTPPLKWRSLMTVGGFFLLILCFLSRKPVFLETWQVGHHTDQQVISSTDMRPLQEHMHLQTMELPGFWNHGNVHMLDCESTRHTGRVDIQRSFPLPNNLTEISESLRHHPMVRHAPPAGDLDPNDPETRSDKYWSQFAGSGVWLPRLRVYFVVSRVVYTRPGTYWPSAS